MWNSMKSVQLSLICTKVVMVLLVVCAATLPMMMQTYINYAYANAMVSLELSDLYPFMAILYLCCIPAMVALICLHKLLTNIKREEVFVSKNVTLLRIISWCCFLAAFIVVFAFLYYFVVGLMSIVLAFIGLILRVVKNVIEEAVHIKTENEFTI